jgi:Proteasome assembly chaperone 4
VLEASLFSDWEVLVPAACLTVLKRTNQSNVISTAIYSSDSSIDYASRVARILARKTALPVYVGCSMNFSGLTVEEEMEGLTKVIETVMTRWKEKL